MKDFYRGDSFSEPGFVFKYPPSIHDHCRATNAMLVYLLKIVYIFVGPKIVEEMFRHDESDFKCKYETHVNNKRDLL